MSSTTIALFREHSDKQLKGQAEGPSEPIEKRSLVAEMSRMQHAIHQLFDEASAVDRENIIRFLELLIRNLKRRSGNE